MLAPIAGLYNPDSYEANAIDVALFVLLIGGFFGVVTKTGAINAGIARTMRALSGREKWMIPILMGMFAAGGALSSRNYRISLLRSMPVYLVYWTAWVDNEGIAPFLVERRSRNAAMTSSS